MDLLLWRHAQAADMHDAIDDLKRPLTKHGESQACEMAAWLKRRLPAHTQILCSPALRARQTVQHLKHNPYQISQELAPDASAKDLLRIAKWPDSKTPVLVVGHQPTLGMTAQYLLNMEMPCSVKKGAIWWLRHRIRDGKPQVVLITVQNPEML